MSTVIVTNLKRDTIHFHPVYREGKMPVVNGKTGKVTKEGGEEFRLELGSQDDDNDEARGNGVLQPKQEVPDWALVELRKIKHFKHLEETHAITVSTPA